MRCDMKRLLIALFICIFVLNINAQKRISGMSRYGFEVNSRPSIYYNTFISHLNGKELILNIKIQNDVLQFQKNDNLYNSKYEISVNLKNKKDNQTFLSESWIENVTLPDFKKTNSKRSYQEFRRKIKLSEDTKDFGLYLEVRDGLTGNVYHNTKTIAVDQQSKNKIKHSKIALIETKEHIQNDIYISASGNFVEFNKSPLVYFEIETPDADSLRIESNIYQFAVENDTLLDSAEYHFFSNNAVFQFVEEINKLILDEGKYRIDYQINYNENRITISDTFDVVWFDKPFYLYKYDLALRPMRYLLAEDEYEYADDLSDNELKEWFLSYWKEKDPTPGTPINEIQLEFYLRVQKAIKEYSLRFKEGWKTDRGEALILYGEPSNIESHYQVAKQKLFEIWYYKKSNKKLIFVGANKNSDFKLTSIEQIEENN